MKVLVLSDSHGCASRMVDLFSDGGYRAVIFLGDVVRDIEHLSMISGYVPVYRVKGNCDMLESAPDEQIIDIEGKLIFITHGHNYHVKSGYGALINAALAKDVDVALCGHTHVQHYELVDKLIVANPGSIASGHYGILTVDGKNIDFELRSIYD